MEESALIDQQSGVARSVSGIPLAGRSSSSSASNSPPREPAAGNNPSGSGGMRSVSCPVSSPATAVAATDEGVSRLDLAIMGCAICLLVPIVLNLGPLTLIWPTLWKVLYGCLILVSFVLAITAFLTAWCPAIAWARRLSPSCARFSLILAVALFVVFTTCKLTRFGCVGGLAAGAVVMIILAVVWVLSEQPSIDAAAAEEGASDSLPPDVP